MREEFLTSFLFSPVGQVFSRSGCFGIFSFLKLLSLVCFSFLAVSFGDVLGLALVGDVGILTTVGCVGILTTVGCVGIPTTVGCVGVLTTVGDVGILTTVGDVGILTTVFLGAVLLPIFQSPFIILVMPNPLKTPYLKPYLIPPATSSKRGLLLNL